MLRVSFPVRHFVTKLYFQFVHILHSLPRPTLDAPFLSLYVCVCPTYLAFVFIFSVIVLFLPCHGNCFLSLSLLLSSSPLPLHVSMLLIICRYVRSIHSAGSCCWLLLRALWPDFSDGTERQQLRQLLVMKLVCHSARERKTDRERYCIPSLICPSPTLSSCFAPFICLPQSMAGCLCLAPSSSSRSSGRASYFDCNGFCSGSSALPPLLLFYWIPF